MRRSCERRKAARPVDALSREQRHDLIRDVYGVISESRARLFAVAMEKTATIGDPYERGFEEMVNRFDLMVSRLSQERDEKQRGLIVVAESAYKNNLNLLAGKIAREGIVGDRPTTSRTFRISFRSGQEHAACSLADFVVNAVYGYYEFGYANEFNRIAPRIDQEPGRMHGLVHIAGNLQNCYCPACVTRRANPRADREYPPIP